MPIPEDLRRRGRVLPPVPFHAAGFTLIELMVTLAVLAVVMAVAMPSFTYVHNSSRLSSAANELVATLQLARMDAIRFNGKVAVCPSSNGAGCTAGGAWTQWVTVADTDRNGKEEVLRVASVKDPIQVLASGNAGNRIEFRADGLARKADGTLLKVSFGVCMQTAKPADNQRTVTLVSGSRISTKAENKASKCDAPQDPA
ncbi:GspH/FimT family pseudopilin [Lysobacter cavernae]|uniref:Type II secretion system protein H n=1 Tax=Lysobacter cavernae TaxID=1685901 RepID=A0ABV7RN00_9GAMM